MRLAGQMGTTAVSLLVRLYHKSASGTQATARPPAAMLAGDNCPYLAREPVRGNRFSGGLVFLPRDARGPSSGGGAGEGQTWRWSCGEARPGAATVGGYADETETRGLALQTCCASLPEGTAYLSVVCGVVRPDLRYAIAIGDDVPEGAVSFKSLLDSGPPAPPPGLAEPDDLCGLFYTSGTTGMPKGAMHCHGSRIVQAIASRRILRSMFEKPLSEKRSPLSGHAAPARFDSPSTDHYNTGALEAGLTAVTTVAVGVAGARTGPMVAQLPYAHLADTASTRSPSSPLPRSARLCCRFDHRGFAAPCP